MVSFEGEGEGCENITGTSSILNTKKNSLKNNKKTQQQYSHTSKPNNKVHLKAEEHNTWQYLSSGAVIGWYSSCPSMFA